MPTGHYERKPRVARITVTCSICNSRRQYLPSIAKKISGKFCSRKCAMSAQKRPPKPRQDKHHLRTRSLSDMDWDDLEVAGLRERLLRKIAKDGDCWLFSGVRTKKGYGRIWSGGPRETGKQVFAHRAAYRVFFGPVPDSLMVCHTCDKPACINPEHLYLGTALDNNQDREARGRRNVKGERHHNSKLTDSAVREIRAGGKSDAAFARQFGVDKALIARVRLHQVWTHLP